MRSIIFVFIFSLFLSTSVMAHPGHDHSSVTSGTIHIVFAVIVLLSIGVGFYGLYNFLSGKKERASNV